MDRNIFLAFGHWAPSHVGEALPVRRLGALLRLTLVSAMLGRMSWRRHFAVVAVRVVRACCCLVTLEGSALEADDQGIPGTVQSGVELFLRCPLVQWARHFGAIWVARTVVSVGVG